MIELRVGNSVYWAQTRNSICLLFNRQIKVEFMVSVSLRGLFRFSFVDLTYL